MKQLDVILSYDLLGAKLAVSAYPMESKQLQ
jgi:hypothetical protein